MAPATPRQPAARGPGLDQDGTSVLSVSQLARQARLLIEENLGVVSVEGELSNFRRPGSGHWYFTIKDQGAQIRCAMFAGRNRAVRIAVNDGLQVRLTGRMSLYEARGDFQLIVDRMEPAGEGALRAAFEALKARLDAEGLFEDYRKQPLPAHPRHLTIISSPSGAALRDVLHVIERRFPGLAVTLIPSAVQGDGAEAELVSALDRAGELDTDVVLLTRGGGSLEDLWAFNLESVARAVADSPHPVVSAIGHQTDFAMTDFVADLRAPTPSAAAELITPTRTTLASELGALQQRLHRNLEQELRYQSAQLTGLARRLKDPAATLTQQIMKVDDLDTRLLRGWQSAMAARQAALGSAGKSLGLLAPARRIARERDRVAAAQRDLHRAISGRLTAQGLSLTGKARALSAVSPLNTLGRGYAVLMQADEHKPVTSIADTAVGDTLTVALSDGSLEVEVRGHSEDSPFASLDPALTDGEKA
ncbi:MAG: exodeoxyribonuclease VII large subunit [Pseudomonadota bacterium]